MLEREGCAGKISPLSTFGRDFSTLDVRRDLTTRDLSGGSSSPSTTGASSPSSTLAHRAQDATSLSCDHRSPPGDTASGRALYARRECPLATVRQSAASAWDSAQQRTASPHRQAVPRAHSFGWSDGGASPGRLPPLCAAGFPGAVPGRSAPPPRPLRHASRLRDTRCRCRVCGSAKLAACGPVSNQRH